MRDRKLLVFFLALALVGGMTAVLLLTRHTTNAPYIDSITPSAGVPGTQVTVQGNYFGTNRNGSGITFSGADAEIMSWSDTTILAIVPALSQSGDVIVRTPNGSSNALRFTLEAGTPGETTTPPAETIPPPSTQTGPTPAP